MHLAAAEARLTPFRLGFTAAHVDGVVVVAIEHDKGFSASSDDIDNPL